MNDAPDSRPSARPERRRPAAATSCAGAVAILVAFGAAAQESTPVELGGLGAALLGLGCAVLLVVLVGGLLLNLGSIHLAARLLRLYGTFWTALKAVLLSWLFAVVGTFVSLLLFSSQLTLGGFLGNLMVSAAAGSMAILIAYETTYLRALGTYLLSSLIAALVSVGLVLALFAVWRPAGENWQAFFEQVDQHLGDFGPGAAAAPAETRYELVPQPLAGAARNVGSHVQVLLRNGERVSGTLLAVTGDGLTIRERIVGGTIELTVARERILEFGLLIPEAPADPD